MAYEFFYWPEIRDAGSSFASHWKMRGPIILMWHAGWRAKDAAFRRCWP